jgi:plastocyanin
MFHFPFGMRSDRSTDTSRHERSRTKRGFGSDFLRSVELLEDRALLSTVTVHLSGMEFSPSAVTIKPGDTVHWVWDGGLHSTTSVPGSAESWDSGVNGAPFTFDHTFTHTGTFAYYCQIHGFLQPNGTVGGMSGTITVGAPGTLQSIAVTPANPSINIGATQQLTATGRFSDSSTEDLTCQATWVSATPSVATVSTTGAATGVSKGTSEVTASFNGINGSTMLTVVAAPPAPAPALTGEKRVPTGKGRNKVLTFQLRFNTPLNSTLVTDVGHYKVVQPGAGRHAPPKVVPVRTAQYSSGNNSVTLTLGKFNVAKPLTLTITGLVGATGTPAATIVTKL